MDKSELEKITLPTKYDISRVQMTGTKYKFKLQKNQLNAKSIIIDSFDFISFRKKQEADIIFFQEKDFNQTDSVAEKILRIMTSRKYRAGSINLLHLEKYKDIFLKNINYFVERNEPVQFMLPAFPFKIKNPLKSMRGDADLAEVASFCKFNEINLQIKKVYPQGAQFHIFHDGHLYYRHFLHSKEDADRYFTSLKRFVNKLGLDNVIKIRDAFEELEKFNDFPETYQKARKEMDNLWARDRNTNKKILAIIKSSHDNINLSDIPEQVLLEINTKKSSDLPAKFQKIKVDIDKRAEACAFEYMTVQHALEKLNFFSRSVPNGIRLTVHPKEGQIGIYLVKKTTFLLPWMGVGVLKRNGEVSVRYEIEVKNNKEFIPVIINSEKFPFYYQQK
jgi:pyoverdine/dityrosine biosynthesis protein Dit1